jgi:hypothetical protein
MSMVRQLCRAVPLFILATGTLCDAVAQRPAAPVVTLSADTKQIELSWPVVPRASYYVVKESATHGSAVHRDFAQDRARASSNPSSAPARRPRIERALQLATKLGLHPDPMQADARAALERK